MNSGADAVLVGIDLGTTVLKAAAFDARRGRCLGHASERLPVRSEAGGIWEQQPRDIDRALDRVIGHLRRQVGRRWAQVAGVGLTSQAGSGILVDRRTGEALTPMLLWNDARGGEERAALARQKPPAFWKSITLWDGPTHGLGRLAWLRRAYPRAEARGALYVGAGEYGYHRLTDVWRQDPGSALQMGCYHVKRDMLDERPLALIPFALDSIAPLRHGHECHPLSPVAARRMGLSAGIPVAGPYFDQEAGYLSAVAAFPRPLQVSLGTAWAGNFVLPISMKGDSSFQIVGPSPLAAGGARFVCQALATGNVAWDWGLRAFAGGDSELGLRRAAAIFREALLPAPGLVCIPWCNWPNPLADGAFGAGVFTGVHARTETKDMLRALAAGLVHELRRMLGCLRDENVVNGIVLGGGASKGDYFKTLLAASFWPLPVHAAEDEGLAGARGAVYAFSKTAAAVTVRRVPTPSPALRAAVQTNFKHYTRVFDALYGRVATGRPFRLR